MWSFWYLSKLLNLQFCIDCFIIITNFCTYFLYFQFWTFFLKEGTSTLYNVPTPETQTCFSKFHCPYFVTSKSSFFIYCSFSDCVYIYNQADHIYWTKGWLTSYYRQMTGEWGKMMKTNFKLSVFIKGVLIHMLGSAWPSWSVRQLDLHSAAKLPFLSLPLIGEHFRALQSNPWSQSSSIITSCTVDSMGNSPSLSFLMYKEEWQWNY